jgi:transposase-like protein
MKAIDEAIAFLHPYDTPNVSEAARRFSVDRSTLSKRFLRKTGSKVKANEMKQLLTKKQELVLVNHISRLCEWCVVK